MFSFKAGLRGLRGRAHFESRSAKTSSYIWAAIFHWAQTVYWPGIARKGAGFPVPRLRRGTRRRGTGCALTRGDLLKIPVCLGNNADLVLSVSLSRSDTSLGVGCCCLLWLFDVKRQYMLEFVGGCRVLASSNSLTFAGRRQRGMVAQVAPSSPAIRENVNGSAHSGLLRGFNPTL